MDRGDTEKWPAHSTENLAALVIDILSYLPLPPQNNERYQVTLGTHEGLSAHSRLIQSLHAKALMLEDFLDLHRERTFSFAAAYNDNRLAECTTAFCLAFKETMGVVRLALTSVFDTTIAWELEVTNFAVTLGTIKKVLDEPPTFGALYHATEGTPMSAEPPKIKTASAGAIRALRDDLSAYVASLAAPLHEIGHAGMRELNLDRQIPAAISGYLGCAELLEKQASMTKENLDILSEVLLFRYHNKNSTPHIYNVPPAYRDFLEPRKDCYDTGVRTTLMIRACLERMRFASADSERTKEAERRQAALFFDEILASSREA